MKAPVDSDERTRAVTSEAQSLGFRFVSMLILIDVAYRSFALKETPWDLLAIVVIGGLFSTNHELRKKVVTAAFVKKMGAAVLVAFVVSVLVVMLRK